jgi:hypothetical protein
MLESEPRVVPVECHERSLYTFVHRKESVLENVNPVTAPNLPKSACRQMRELEKRNS